MYKTLTYYVGGLATQAAALARVKAVTKGKPAVFKQVAEQANGLWSATVQYPAALGRVHV